jgi:NAD(P)-dependent dehydrogenase (short-subunit alcohol dehydrogenase family)
MDLQLANKKALVTGSSAGIGFAIASLLAREGASVVVNGRSRQRVEQAVQRIQKERKSVQVTGVTADLGTKDGVDLMIREELPEPPERRARPGTTGSTASGASMATAPPAPARWPPTRTGRIR